MGIVVRRAVQADEDTLYQMLCDLENEALDRTAFGRVFRANMLLENIAYFVAESNEGLVGMASCHVQLLLHHAAPVGEIQEMYVAPALRSQGIGKALIGAVFQFAAQRGARQVEVTSNKIRHDTHRFYEREGFQKTHDKLVWKVSPEA
jgi:(aminoalkyl)phosphonate N-acetyltransferase